MPDIGIFELEFENTVSQLKSAPSNLSDCKFLGEGQNCLNLGPKIHYLGIFGMELEKGFVIIRINTLEFF